MVHGLRSAIHNKMWIQMMITFAQEIKRSTILNANEMYEMHIRDWVKVALSLSH